MRLDRSTDDGTQFLFSVESTTTEVLFGMDEAGHAEAAQVRVRHPVGRVRFLRPLSLSLSRSFFVLRIPISI